MKSFLIGLFFIALTVSSVSFAGDKESAYDRVIRTGVLRCGYFVWAPHFSVNMKDGKKSGVYYDIIEELGKSLNLKIDWSYEYTLGQQVEALKHKADARRADRGAFRAGEAGDRFAVEAVVTFVWLVQEPEYVE